MSSKHLLVFFFGVMLLITPRFAYDYQAYKPPSENSQAEKMSTHTQGGCCLYCDDCLLCADYRIGCSTQNNCRISCDWIILPP